jgi:hypothetical protein
VSKRQLGDSQRLLLPGQFADDVRCDFYVPGKFTSMHDYNTCPDDGVLAAT